MRRNSGCIAMLAMFAMLATAPGCLTQSEVSNDSNDRAAGIYMPIGSLDVSMPEMPAPVEGEPPDAFKARLKAWTKVGGALAEAIAQVEMPELLAGISVSDIQYWKDQRGTGGAETRARGEGGIDGAVGVGGSHVEKQGGATRGDEESSEERKVDTDLGDNSEPEPEPEPTPTD
jgi:hypothetical protein